MATRLRRTAAFAALGRALTSGSRGGPSVARRVRALPRMIKATLRGEYDGRLRLGMIAAGLAYVVSPVDLVPEALLLLAGLADDALVVTWLAGAVLDETERFLEWERGRRRVVDGVHGTTDGAHGTTDGAHGTTDGAADRATDRAVHRRARPGAGRRR